MRVKEESEKAGLKLSIKKTKIMASGPITSLQMGKVETGEFYFLGPGILQARTLEWVAISFSNA